LDSFSLSPGFVWILKDSTFSTFFFHPVKAQINSITLLLIFFSFSLFFTATFFFPPLPCLGGSKPINGENSEEANRSAGEKTDLHCNLLVEVEKKPIKIKEKIKIEKNKNKISFFCFYCSQNTNKYIVYNRGGRQGKQ